MKWYYLLVVVVVSCNQSEKIENENWKQMVEYIDEYKHVYYIDDNRLFQGDYIIYNEKGEIAAKHKYQNAELIDTSKFYHLGSLNSIQVHNSYRNSKRSIFYYPSGKIKQERVLFNNGEIHSYYQNNINKEIISDSSNFLLCSSTSSFLTCS
jgi:antitoxin component YwqK of YwqJK toxin-antitoxin module